MTALDTPLLLAHGRPWSNRITLAALTNDQSRDDGTLSDDEYSWLVARGRGGFGMTRTCAAYVSPEGRAWHGQLGVADDSHLPGLTVLAEGLSATGTRSMVQLHHGGLRADPVLTGTEVLSPWPKEGTSARTMSTDEIDLVVAAFGQAAARAERAGFDGVEVHGAHGYLLSQFMDERNNGRTDRYGGSTDNRGRVFLEVLEEIRRQTGRQFQVGIRLTPEGNGISLAAGRDLAARVMESELADFLDLSLWDVFATPRFGDPGLLIDHFMDLPRHGTVVGVAGRILSRSDAQWCLDRGADYVSIGVAGILHHDWAARAISDPSFAARERPVPAEDLAKEHVGPAFIDYLRRNWDDFVVE